MRILSMICSQCWGLLAMMSKFTNPSCSSAQRTSSSLHMSESTATAYSAPARTAYILAEMSISSARVELQDFCGLSSRVTLYTASDDYSKGAMTNPTIPLKYRNVTSGPVVLRKHVIVGAGSVILPGVTLGLASSVGALSLVHRDTLDFSIVAGSPARAVGTRSDRILELEQEFLDETSGSVE